MENKMNSETSLQQSENPTPCSTGCGFFGSSATMNMCSKCYRDHRLKEEQAVTAIAAVGRSVSSTLLTTSVVTGESCNSKLKEAVVDTEVAAATVVVKKVANRCGSCNKKVGVVGFKCRCGLTFCGSHRYPEEHDCKFDYKSSGRDEIAKANPLVVADKVLRF